MVRVFHCAKKRKKKGCNVVDEKEEGEKEERERVQDRTVVKKGDEDRRDEEGEREKEGMELGICSFLLPCLSYCCCVPSRGVYLKNLGSK